MTSSSSDMEKGGVDNMLYFTQQDMMPLPPLLRMCSAPAAISHSTIIGNKHKLVIKESMRHIDKFSLPSVKKVIIPKKETEV